jgi:hypothetical protein
LFHFLVAMDRMLAEAGNQYPIARIGYQIKATSIFISTSSTNEIVTRTSPHWSIPAVP